jgi:hypothetical protein
LFAYLKKQLIKLINYVKTDKEKGKKIQMSIREWEFITDPTDTNIIIRENYYSKYLKIQMK